MWQPDHSGKILPRKTGAVQSWKTLRSLVSIWVKTLSIFIARIVAGRLFTVIDRIFGDMPATAIAMEACGGSYVMARKLERVGRVGRFPKAHITIIHTKTGTPAWSLGQGFTVQKKQRCRHSCSGNQAGQNTSRRENKIPFRHRIDSSKPTYRQNRCCKNGRPSNTLLVTQSLFISCFCC